MMQTVAAGDTDLAGYLRFIEETFTPAVLDRPFPIVLGEWCIDPLAGSIARLPADELGVAYRALAEAQLRLWPQTDGWFWWSYKLLTGDPDRDGWDLRHLSCQGVSPGFPGGRRVVTRAAAPRRWWITLVVRPDRMRGLWGDIRRHPALR